MKEIIYFDMDGTIFDFDNAALCNVPTEVRDYYQDKPDFYVAKRFPEKWRGAIEATYNNPEFFENLELLPGAKDAWEATADYGFDPVILSSPLSSNPRAEVGKRISLEKHFGSVVAERAIIDKRKWLYSGLALIDDRPNPARGNLSEWQSILFHQNHNRLASAAFRLMSWQDPEKNLIPLLETIKSNR